MWRSLNQQTLKGPAERATSKNVKVSQIFFDTFRTGQKPSKMSKYVWTLFDNFRVGLIFRPFLGGFELKRVRVVQ